MPINIKQQPVTGGDAPGPAPAPAAENTPQTQASPHAEAAQALETTTETTTTHNSETGEETITDHTQDNAAVPAPASHDTVTVGMSFRMPVAQYVMIEFKVERSTPCAADHADTVFETNKAWAEARINQLVEEQQAEG